MSDAPERIVTSQCGKIIVHHDMKRFETDVEYIRADHVESLLKAEREKTLREAAGTVQLGDTVQNIQRRILALIENPAG